MFTLTLPHCCSLEAEEAEGRLEGLGALAVARNEIDEGRGAWEVIAYFATRDAAELARTVVGRDGARVTTVPNADWVRRSLEGLPPVSAGRFFLHGAHDRERRRAGGISLEIDAGTAFGTGHHGTTLGCLVAFDRLLKRVRPRCVLDLGCGTGVLAIAAARALRCRVLASDIDPEAVRVTRRNASNNRAGPLVAVSVAAGLDHPRLRAGAPYDLVFANILARPLVALAPSLSSAVAPRGALILSGLTRDQERRIRAVYRNRGFVPRPAIRLGPWSTLAFTQKKSARRSGRPVTRSGVG